MMTAAKIVETVPWIDAKYYAATQTMDEARHTEVFAKYLHTKLGEAYPMSPFLEDADHGPPRGQPLGHRLPRHADRHREPGAGRLRHDAARHRGAAAQEAAALRHVRRGPPRRLRRAQPGRVLPGPDRGRAQGPPGVPGREHPAQPGRGRPRPRSGSAWASTAEAVCPCILEAAGKLKVNPFAGFQRGFFAKLVPNVRKLGLLDANDGYLRKAWDEAGLLEFEFADDTGSDYASYDAVAQDRAGVGRAAARDARTPARRGRPRRRGRRRLADRRARPPRPGPRGAR